MVFTILWLTVRTPVDLISNFDESWRKEDRATMTRN